MTEETNMKTPKSATTSTAVGWTSFLKPTVVGVVFRLVVYIFLHDYLEDNVSVVAPWNSFQHLRDALALWRNGIGLYTGDYHSAPWVASMFSPVLNQNYLLLAIFTMFDLAAAYFFFRFTAEFLADKSDDALARAVTVFSIYFLNPLGVGVCAAFSLSSFINFLLTAALYFNHKQTSSVTVLLIGLVVQLNVYYVVLLFAVNTGNNEEPQRQSIRRLSVYFALVAAFYVANGMFVNLSDYFNGNIMFFMKIEDHTPNLGNFWYMFVQVFPHYRVFFLFVFQILAFIYAYPFWRILKEYPLTLWFIYLQLVAITSSYPTYAELCAYFPLFFVFVMYHKYYNFNFLIYIVLPISFATSAITLMQWLQTDSGNANFYFGSCTAYILSLVGLAYDVINAHLVDVDVKLSGVTDPSAHRYYLNVPAQRQRLNLE